jgi:hypothetical protein
VTKLLNFVAASEKDNFLNQHAILDLLGEICGIDVANFKKEFLIIAA